MCDKNDAPVTWTDHDGKVVHKQSRDFIDGFGQGVEHGRRMEREDAKYWEGFERGLKQGMAHVLEMTPA